MTTIRKPIPHGWLFATILLLFGFAVTGKCETLPFEIKCTHNQTDSIPDYRENQITIVMGKIHIPAVVSEIGNSKRTSGKIILKKIGRLYELPVPYSQKLVFKLPNETVVYLNSNSTLLIDPAKNYFELSGEGYFKFSKDSNTIKARNNITIKADSGDCVNLTCYSDYVFEPILTATLSKGSNVIVSSEKESFNLIAPFNQVVIAKTYIDSVTNANVSQAVIWTKETYRYDNIDPFLLIARIGRWYNVRDIEFPHTGPRRNMNFAGNFKWSFKKAITEFAHSSNDVTYRIENDRLIVCKYSLLN